MKRTEEKLNFFTTARFLWGYMKDMKYKYITFYIGWLFQTVVGVVTPIVVGNMIDQVIYYNDLSKFLKLGVGFLGITILGIVVYYLVYEMYGVLWNGINRRLRMGMFEQLQNLSAVEAVALQHGDTVNMIQFWSTEGVNFMIRNIVHNANNIFRILLCLGIMFYVHPVFGAVSVVLVPVSAYTAAKLGKRIRKNSGKNKEKYAAYISWLYEVADSLGEIRLWSAERTILKKYDDKLKELNGLDAKIEMDNCLGNELLANSKNLILVVQYGLLAYYAVMGELNIGTVTVMLSYFTTLSTSLSELAKNHMDAQSRISVMERIRDFFGKERMASSVEMQDLEETVHEVIFRNCSFGYREELPVLDGIDFSVKRGERVAIVGASGAGKSTLLNLVLGLYEPNKGEILLNGTDLSRYSKASLYEHFSVVFQQVVLFRGTIRENLQMGKELLDETLKKACQAAGIYEYVTQQEKGFDAILERGGANLSGGQRQRFGIARAYLQASDVVILDEATAALDAENEELILENWDEVLQGRACVVVSHRLRTVRECDREILLKDGTLFAEGTPQELEQQCPEYRELFAL